MSDKSIIKHNPISQLAPFCDEYEIFPLISKCFYSFCWVFVLHGKVLTCGVIFSRILKFFKSDSKKLLFNGYKKFKL